MATNGSTEEKKVSRIAQLTEGVDPAKADLKAVKKLMAEYRKLDDEIRAADELAKKAREKQYEIAEKVVQQTGKSPITIDGVRFVPSSRGDTVFFKNQSELDTLEL